MTLARLATLALAAALATQGACVNRILRLENKVLERENADLHRRLTVLERAAPDPVDWKRDPDLATIHEFLGRAGYNHQYMGEGSVIQLQWTGRNKAFTIVIQHFTAPDVLYMATGSYLTLDDAQNTPSVVLLMVQLSVLNYELPVGKFQLNPQTGEILLSSELHLGDGLGYHTFLAALENLGSVADEKYPELRRAATGVGM